MTLLLALSNVLGNTVRVFGHYGIRERRGIFRLALYPQPDRPDLVLWWLWSRGRSDVPAGVFSHSTALSLHDLTDTNPGKIDLTVPAAFRRGAAIPSVLRLHFADIPKSEREVMGGVPVTNALRTILDTRKDGKLPLAPLKQAFEQALRSGKVTKRQVAEARDDPHRASILNELERGAD